MEYKRRRLSSVVDDDIEKQVTRRRGTSTSLDDQIDEYTEYMYTGTFNVSSSIFNGILNLICPCFCARRSQPINSTTSVE